MCLQKGPLKGQELEQHFLSLRHDINPKGLVPQDGVGSDIDGETGVQHFALHFSAAHGFQGSDRQHSTVPVSLVLWWCCLRTWPA